jgi:hypothetical protein
MNASQMPTLPMLALAAALAAGCAVPVDAPAADLPEPVAAPKAQGVALRLEQAERSLDVGRDVAGARASLEEALRDPSMTLDQRDQARLALSRALEAGGDREAAVAPLEALLADHPEGQETPAEEAAEARLRKLLTGVDAEPPSAHEDARPAPAFAHALTRYFTTPNAGNAPIEVSLLAFGGSIERSDRLGTFAVDRAVREDRRQACSLCDDHLSIRMHSSRTGSWVGIPKSRARLGKSLAVFYFDLGGKRIPARYDAELPLPSAEIAARLERGDGLVAARERPGAPPAILIAAPREAQLAEVEEALAAMKTLPVEPVTVQLKAALRPEEIQGVVRASFGAYRACYESVLKNDPAAAGTARLHFSIRGDGAVEGVSVETPEGALHDATFEACMSTPTRGLVFPANRATTPTVVTYPIAFAPPQ